MANSRFAYVRKFESNDSLLPDTWIAVRIDGRGFHRFTDAHGYTKPNDAAGLRLMAKSARHVLEQITDLQLAYGQSDEFSFVFPPQTRLYQRRASKLTSAIVSLFSSAFVFFWPSEFPDRPLQHPPSFDARAVCYPTLRHLRDYLSWRQADCHINNLYNTAFWALVASGEAPAAAQGRLKDTVSSVKHELLFKEFGVNYAHEPAEFRRGTTLVRVPASQPTLPAGIVEEHEDLIGNAFWQRHPHLSPP